MQLPANAMQPGFGLVELVSRYGAVSIGQWLGMGQYMVCLKVRHYGTTLSRPEIPAFAQRTEKKHCIGPEMYLPFPH